MPTRSLLYLSLLSLGGWLASSCASTNRTDHFGRSRGRWRTYYDEAARTRPFTAGRYRHGRPVGTFRYYGPTGTLAQTERYGREGYCEVTYWYPGGQVERRGHAQWVTGAKGARFYWFGPWTRYTEAGQVRAVETYTDGTHTATDVYTNGRLTATQIYQNGRLVETRAVQ